MLFLHYVNNDKLNLTMQADSKRTVWIDWMRVAACLMVILVHSTEPFYLGGNGSLILT